ncbi:MAG: acyl-CoA reductase, partial [Flavobacteriaceae bacterium]|nr:acyl-CoA reductase [Flavobacteriaceae bacterium]
TKDSVLFAIEEWSKLLNINNINTWISKYNFKNTNSKTVAIIMAGNIPLVGFHDFLSALITGHRVLVKQSSHDKHFLPLLVSYLEHLDESLKGRIQFTDGKLENFDAVIATGSDNTARYFEYYFKNKASIIRKNRNSVAVLTGNETPKQLAALSEDIFRYYGLGCRNVSKIFVPKNYAFDAFFNAMYSWHPIINDVKYANNYDYNKAVYLMSEFDLLENGFLMLKEDASYSSPIATVFYEYYNTLEEIKDKLTQD